MLSGLLIFIYKQTTLIKTKKNILFSVHRNSNVWPKAYVEALSWAKCQIFSKTLLICNDIDKNLSKNFHT